MQIFYGVLIGIAVYMIIQSIFIIVYLAGGQADDDLLLGVFLYTCPVIWFIYIFQGFLKLIQLIYKILYKKHDKLLFNCEDGQIYRVTPTEFEFLLKHNNMDWRKCDCVIEPYVYESLKSKFKRTKAKLYVLNFVTLCFSYCSNHILKYFPKANIKLENN